MQGLIFIPDITGFTHFVKTIDIDLGVSITKDLLNDIIENIGLDIQLSEIEGDAVLFYKMGEPINLKTLLTAYDNLSVAFATRYAIWKAKYNLKVDLSLKLIVHYGEIVDYSIRGFRKIYGEAVIESHRLLKNNSTSGEYILITDDYVDALEKNNMDSSYIGDHYTSYNSYLSTDLRKINYAYYSNSGNEVVELNKKDTREIKLPADTYMPTLSKVI